MATRAPLPAHSALCARRRCAALRSIKDDVEKEHAFLGLCAVLRINPQVLLSPAWLTRGPLLTRPCSACTLDPSWAHTTKPAGRAEAACVAYALQGAAAAFVPLCEAVTSWQRVANDGLQNELVQLMQGYKQQLTASGQWEQAMAAVSPAVKQKLSTMCGV